jgi:2-polyprenyl-6-hydroxyphenyl methylase/3-demethylubiquinone-9 3-methyltransferase
MAQRGAEVTGIDLSDQALKVAQLHTLESGAVLDYVLTSAEDLATLKPATFDVVTCMELLEHVPDPASTVRACAALVKPGGHLFFSTINRNLKSYLFAVVGAEYVLRLLPRGTHRYEKFVKPSELAAFCRQSGLDARGVVGMTYNPLTGRYSLGADTDVNYIMHCSA